MRFMFRTVPLSIIRSFSLYTAMLYVIYVCWQLASRIRMKLPVPSWTCSQALIWETGACSWFYYKKSEHNVKISYTEFQQNRTTNVERMDRYSFIPFNKLLTVNKSIFTKLTLALQLLQRTRSIAVTRSEMDGERTTYLHIRHSSFHFVKNTITIQLMSYGEIMAVCSQIHTTHTQIHRVAKALCTTSFKLVVHKVTTGVDKVDVPTYLTHNDNNLLSKFNISPGLGVACCL
jgi:hypothetical protein